MRRRFCFWSASLSSRLLGFGVLRVCAGSIVFYRADLLVTGARSRIVASGGVVSTFYALPYWPGCRFRGLNFWPHLPRGWRVAPAMCWPSAIALALRGTFWYRVRSGECRAVVTPPSSSVCLLSTIPPFYRLSALRGPCRSSLVVTVLGLVGPAVACACTVGTTVPWVVLRAIGASSWNS